MHFISIILIFIAHFSPIHSYSHSLALSAYQYSLISFCGSESISQWSCGFLCSSLPPLTGILSFYGPNSSFFYIAHETSTNRTYLIFRSSEFKESGSDLWEVQNDPGLPYYENCTEKCLVLTRPFLQMQFLKPYVYRALDYYWSLTNGTSINGFVLTGNGLGGSLAEYFALEMINDGIYANISKELYTFGSPAPGNLPFFKFAEDQKKNSTLSKWRVTYNKDPCPFFPDNFVQWNDEIFYNMENKFRVCENSPMGIFELDPSCSIQFRNNWDFEDHYKFFKEDARELLSDCLDQGNSS